MSCQNFSAKVSPVQATIRQADGSRDRVVMNEAENALCWLFRRKGADGRPLISAVQFAAGEKLREDYTFGHMAPRVTAAWNGGMTSGSRRQAGAPGFSPADSAMAARARFARAVDAVGPELGGILLEVCCLEAGLEQAERAMNLPKRSGKAVLTLALTRLARHYGLIGNDATRKFGHTGLPDYRPAIREV